MVVDDALRPVVVEKIDLRWRDVAYPSFSDVWVAREALFMRAQGSRCVGSTIYPGYVIPTSPEGVPQGRSERKLRAENPILIYNMTHATTRLGK